MMFGKINQNEEKNSCNNLDSLYHMNSDRFPE